MKKYALITIAISTIIVITTISVVVLHVVNGFFDKHRLAFYPIVVFHAPIIIENRKVASAVVTKVVYVTPTPALLK